MRSGSFQEFARDIKLTHSVFAMPFAVASFFLLALGSVSLWSGFLVLVAMVSARSYAMGMNRWVDAGIDAANPRTTQRAIPSGRLGRMQVLLWSLGAGALFIGSAFLLNKTAGYCSFPVLFLLGIYGYWKRWSWGAHFYLGLCLGLVPWAVYVAFTGQFYSVSAWLLGGAILFWTAGFDMIYALQDWKFDRDHNLHSVPVSFGPRGALMMSRLAFVAMIVLLTALGMIRDYGWIYYSGLVVIAGFLAYEHWLVRDAKDDGQSVNMNQAFFTINASVSLIFLTFLALDRLFL